MKHQRHITAYKIIYRIVKKNYVMKKYTHNLLIRGKNKFTLNCYWVKDFFVVLHVLDCDNITLKLDHPARV